MAGADRVGLDWDVEEERREERKRESNRENWRLKERQEERTGCYSETEGKKMVWRVLQQQQQQK